MYFFLIYMEIQSKEMVFFFSLMFYLQNKTKQKKICQVWLKLPVLLNLLVACTRLCKLLCQSVRRSIGRSLFTKYVTYGDWPCLYIAIFHILFLFLALFINKKIQSFVRTDCIFFSVNFYIDLHFFCNRFPTDIGCRLLFHYLFFVWVPCFDYGHNNNVSLMNQHQSLFSF